MDKNIYLNKIRDYLHRKVCGKFKLKEQIEKKRKSGNTHMLFSKIIKMKVSNYKGEGADYGS